MTMFSYGISYNIAKEDFYPTPKEKALDDMSQKKGSPSDPLTPGEARNAITAAILSDLVPLVLGAPGVGKTEIMREVGKKLGLPVKVILLAQREPVDFVGVPHVELDPVSGQKRSHFAPPMEFITDKPVLLFLDEFLQAPLETQRAASEIILDRTVGGIPLHKDTKVVCASNRKEDRAGTGELLGHNKSRLTTMYVAPTVKDWVNWATGANIHPSVIQYINDKGIDGLCPKIDHKDFAYPCPRTWAKVSNVVHAYAAGKFKGLGDKGALTPLVIGCVGEKNGPEFIQYLARMESMPDPADIEKSPMTAKIPTGAEDQVTYARTLMGRYKQLCDAGLRKQYKAYLGRFHVDTLVPAHQQLTGEQKACAELAADLRDIRRAAQKEDAA